MVIIVACLALLPSCGVTYSNPPKDPAKTAMLKSRTDRSGLYTWSNYIVQSVDNKPINYSMSLTMEGKDIVLTSGKHELVVEGSFNQGFMLPGPFCARGDLTLNAVAGKNYQANGAIKGSKLQIWIEDSETHKPTTDIVSIPYQNIPQATYVPIIIPAG